LPIFLILYFASPFWLKNSLLFAASLFFYFTSSGALTLILVLSVIGNFFVARLIEGTSAKRTWLVVGVLGNLCPLLYYKYADFGVGTLADILQIAGVSASLQHPHPLLPIGISFYTFQAVSYIADIYMRRTSAEHSLINFGMYHSCFPQLIAGPIVRYEEIAGDIRQRRHSIDDVYLGAVQFGFGLGKKVVIADNMALVADPIFASPNIDLPMAWLGIVAYTLQIYFDFSGYSDMAIGIGRMLGFPYPENFNQPYRSRSITEFWRRWHMTLSRWFKDYVYVPMGGNRMGLGRTTFNLMLVFFLCGLWHGAAYTFILWGLYHGMLLIFERVAARWTAWRPSAGLGWFYSIVAVMIGWVLFRATDVAHAVSYVGAMFDVRRLTLSPEFVYVLTSDKAAYLTLGVFLALVPYEWFLTFRNRQYDFPIGLGLCSLAVTAFSIVLMSVNGFSSFIYFRF